MGLCGIHLSNFKWNAQGISDSQYKKFGNYTFKITVKWVKMCVDCIFTVQLFTCSWFPGHLLVTGRLQMSCHVRCSHHYIFRFFFLNEMDFWEVVKQKTVYQGQRAITQGKKICLFFFICVFQTLSFKSFKYVVSYLSNNFSQTPRSPWDSEIW